MASFEVFIDDDRYRVPSLYLIDAVDEGAARRLASKLWRESAHHLGVELRRDGVRLHGEGSMTVDDASGSMGVAAAG